MTIIQKTSRVSWDISQDWLFVPRKISPTRDDVTGLHGGYMVDLPHCWNTQDTFQHNVEYRRGHGTYNKRLQIPSGFKPDGSSRLMIVSEGFYGTGSLLIDGQYVQPFDGAYIGFESPVPGHLSQGRIINLTIQLSNDCRRNVLPGIRMPDFLLYGGLAGRIFLVEDPHLNISSTETLVHISEEAPDTFRVDIRWRVNNRHAGKKTCDLIWAIEGPSGVLDEGKSVSLDAGTSISGTSSLLIKNPVRWDLDAPVLYLLRGTLVENGITRDTCKKRIGFRSAQFTRDNGFLLNGRRVILRGCNRHESIPGLGNALMPDQHREDARLLKSFGFNFVRLSHYPQHPSFLDACDELGILVYAELASWKSVRGGGWKKRALHQLNRMIRRDHHHPSVILWGLGNEGRHRGAFRALDGLAKQLDPGRPTIYAENHLYRAVRRKTLGLTDVWGFNYELGEIKEVRSLARTGAGIISECSNEPHTARGDLEAEARQTRRILDDLARSRIPELLSGYAIWSFNDYATLRKKRFLRYSGVFDAWRIPKMAAYAHRALAMDEPQLQIFASGGSPSSVNQTVHIISNCDQLRWSNGREGGDITPGGIHACISIPFAEAPAIIRGSRQGAIIEQTLPNYGEASSVQMSMAGDRSNMARNELCAIDITVMDQRGLQVQNWNGILRLLVEGPATLCAYTPGQEVLIRSGEGRVWIRGGRWSGQVTIRLWHENLKAAPIRLENNGADLSSDRIVVAHVTSEPYPGEAEERIIMIMAAQQKSGIVPVLFCPRGSPIGEHAKQQGLLVRDLAIRNSFDLLGAIQFSGALKSDKCRLVHVHACRAPGIISFASRRAGLPLVVSVLARDEASIIRHGHVDRVVVGSIELEKVVLNSGISRESIRLEQSSIQIESCQDAAAVPYLQIYQDLVR